MTVLLPTRRAIVAGALAAPFLLSGIARAGSVDPFTLGVAAGDALPDGFVIWTRLAPDPLAPGGGMDAGPQTVTWEVAEDEGFRTIVGHGTETAWPELAHSVHVEVAGLKPARPYWYRFRAMGAQSASGRVLTTPATGTRLDRVRFAALGCQSYECGYYTALGHVAEEPIDFVFHYGDYIYESETGDIKDGLRRPFAPVRRYQTPMPVSLDDYRRRHAEVTIDPDTRAARAAHGWYCTYDDHEVRNDWTGDHDHYGTPAALFLLRRKAALQAWYEHMPVRRASFPAADGTVEFRHRVDFGDLMRMHILNTRLHRDPQPCDDAWVAACAGMTGEVLGTAQQGWLDEGLRSSGQRWQLLAQQVMVAPLDRRQTGSTATAPVINTDSWAGYPLARQRLYDSIAAHRGGNVVVVTGDEHQNWAIDLVDANGRPIASEYVATSISSGGDGWDVRPGNERIMADNPALKWSNDRRGYLVTDVTRDAWTGHFRTVDAISTRGLPVRTAGSWAIAAGKAGMHRT